MGEARVLRSYRPLKPLSWLGVKLTPAGRHIVYLEEVGGVSSTLYSVTLLPLDCPTWKRRRPGATNTLLAQTVYVAHRDSHHNEFRSTASFKGENGTVR